MDEAYNKNQTLLFRFFHSRDIGLRNEIVEANLGLVRSTAYKMTYACQVPLDDLIQIGSYGLIKAVDRFNPYKRRKLSSFAIPFIKGSILQFMRDKDRSVRIPRNLYETYQRIQKYSRSHACSYSDAAIALNINTKIASDAYIAWNSHTGDIPQHLPSVVHPQDEIPYELLTQRELKVITLLYFDEKSIKHVAEYIELSYKQTISIRDTALEKLRTSMTGLIKCPKCGSCQTSRNGKRSGKQSHICKDCGYQFIENPLPRGRRGYSEDMRIQVLEAINQGRSFYWCETYLGIDHATAHHWSKKYTINIDSQLTKFLSKKIMTKPQQRWQIVAKFNNLADWLSKNCPESTGLESALTLLNKSMQQMINDTEPRK